jgi:hypothetical protein
MLRFASQRSASSSTNALSEEHGVDLTQRMLREELVGSLGESLANVDEHGPLLAVGVGQADDGLVVAALI